MYTFKQKNIHEINWKDNTTTKVVNGIIITVKTEQTDEKIRQVQAAFEN